MKIEQFIEENFPYINCDIKKAAIESLTQDEFEAAIIAARLLTEDEEALPGIHTGLAVTHETLANFEDSRRNYWTDKGTMQLLEIARYNALRFDRFQPLKGS